MTILDWMILPLRRYARFNGRARPREYWMFVLLVVLALVALSILETALGLAVTEQWVRTGPVLTCDIKWICISVAVI